METAGTMKNFTVMELLIVIAIIGLLAGIAMPKLTEIYNINGVERAKDPVISILSYAKSYALASSQTQTVNFSQTPSEITVAYTLHTGANKIYTLNTVDYTLLIDTTAAGAVTFDKAANADTHEITITHRASGKSGTITINPAGGILWE